jgi:hypothetical protein
MASEVLFQDHDILGLFDVEMDGIGAVANRPAMAPSSATFAGSSQPHWWRGKVIRLLLFARGR